MSSLVVSKIPIGTLRHLVTLQSPKGTRDAVGERVTTFEDVATVYANVAPLSSQEQFLAAQRKSSNTHTITVRYSSAISAVDASWRVKYGPRIFVIDGVTNIDELNELFELRCTEGLRQK